MVTNVDEAGTLTLSTLQPVDGIDVTATLTDIDSVNSESLTGAVTVCGHQAWKWAKSLNHAMAPMTDIDEARSSGHLQAERRVDLEPLPASATATYTDPQGSDKTARWRYRRVSGAGEVRSDNEYSPGVPDQDLDDGVAIRELTTAITREVAENSAAGTAM